MLYGLPNFKMGGFFPWQTVSHHQRVSHDVIANDIPSIPMIFPVYPRFTSEKWVDFPVRKTQTVGPRWVVYLRSPHLSQLQGQRARDDAWQHGAVLQSDGRCTGVRDLKKRSYITHLYDICMCVCMYIYI